MKARLFLLMTLLLFPALSHAQVLGDPADVSQDFQKMENVYFVGSRVTSFDTATGQGTLQWDRYLRNTTLSFNKIDVGFTRGKATEFPGTEYDQDPALPFSITFVSPRTVRLRLSTRAVPMSDGQSLMLAGPVPKDGSWKVEQNDREIVYTGANGRVRIIKQPWHIEIYDKGGRLLTRTQNIGDPATFITPIPFSFVRRSRDLARRIAATFELQHDEKIFGCGESFTRSTSADRSVCLDARRHGRAERVHVQADTLFPEQQRVWHVRAHQRAVDLRLRQILRRAQRHLFRRREPRHLSVPRRAKRHSFGVHRANGSQSRAAALVIWLLDEPHHLQLRRPGARGGPTTRSHQVPADVIHLDTGWFETDWRSDYKFSTSRFRDPAKMIADLKQQGFHVSLWQYTYFTSKNELWKEMVEKGYTSRTKAVSFRSKTRRST
jgi:alpha-D-xyloside xylohydrolase